MIDVPGRRDARGSGAGCGVLGPPGGEEFGERRNGLPPLLNAQWDDFMRGDRQASTGAVRRIAGVI